MSDPDPAPESAPETTNAPPEAPAPVPVPPDAPATPPVEAPPAKTAFDPAVHALIDHSKILADLESLKGRLRELEEYIFRAKTVPVAPAPAVSDGTQHPNSTVVFGAPK